MSTVTQLDSHAVWKCGRWTTHHLDSSRHREVCMANQRQRIVTHGAVELAEREQHHAFGAVSGSGAIPQHRARWPHVAIVSLAPHLRPVVGHVILRGRRVHGRLHAGR